MRDSFKKMVNNIIFNIVFLTIVFYSSILMAIIGFISFVIELNDSYIRLTDKIRIRRYY